VRRFLAAPASAVARCLYEFQNQADRVHSSDGLAGENERHSADADGQGQEGGERKLLAYRGPPFRLGCEALI